MRIIIVTGGLGAGKSTATRFFVERGALVLSLDEIAHEVLSPGSVGLSRVAQEFGEQVIAADGSLDRAALAELAFACQDCAERLNALVHPLVVEETRARLARAVAAHKPATAVVLEVPLLAEAPELCELADVVLAIEAPENDRMARAVARGMDQSDALHRIACQASDEERAALATHVIANDGDESHFARELEGFWGSLDAAATPEASR